MFNPKKRGMRISLKALMVATVVAACGAVWLGSEVRRCQLENDAIAWLQTEYAHPITVRYGNRFDNSFLGSRLQNTTAGAHWLTHLLGVDIFQTVKSLEVTAPGNTLTWDEISPGRWIPNVEYTNGLNSNQLSHILAFHHLMSLDLSSHPITDDDIKKLNQIDSLQELWLSKTKVTDNGATYFKQFRNLRSLGVANTRLSEAMLNQLNEIPGCNIYTRKLRRDAQGNRVKPPS